MADSTSRLDLLVNGQYTPDVTQNALNNSMSPAALFGRRSSTSGALSWGYYGGAMMLSGVPTIIPNGTIALTGSTTNYIEANPSTGAVSVNTSAWTSGKIPLYKVVAGSTTVTSWQDFRCMQFAAVP